jgi:hypothetical protein
MRALQECDGKTLTRPPDGDNRIRAKYFVDLRLIHCLDVATGTPVPYRYAAASSIFLLFVWRGSLLIHGRAAGDNGGSEGNDEDTASIRFQLHVIPVAETGRSEFPLCCVAMQARFVEWPMARSGSEAP